MERLQPAAGILLLLILSFPNLGVQAPRQSKAITVRGTLARVAGIGGETTGWAMQLDSEIQVRGERVKSIEVSGDSREFDRLENKHVEATGKAAVRHGVTRGEWSVLEINTIRESTGKHLG